MTMNARGRTPANIVRVVAGSRPSASPLRTSYWCASITASRGCSTASCSSSNTSIKVSSGAWSRR
jgi:hypothetical protein